MPRPVTVWAVELGSGAALRETEGRLALGSDALTFSPDERAGGPIREPLRIPFDAIAKVRRVRGSPVLMVVHRGELGRRRTAFYFVPPPSLDVLLGQKVERPSGLAGLRNPRRKARRDNVGYLGVANREKRRVIAEWVRAVRAALAGGSA
jgi:hypothetical protein